jgi:hypothetical protein
MPKTESRALIPARIWPGAYPRICQPPVPAERNSPRLFSAITRLLTHSSNGRMAFVPLRDGNWEIHGLNADGSGATNLTNNPADDWSPAWAPG